MPRRYVAAGCNTVSGDGYSLHAFPRDQDLRTKWIRAVKRQRSNWDGPSTYSMLCSKHFEPECFVTEGVRYRDAIGLPTKKRLKPDAMSTVFPRSIYSGGRPRTPPLKPVAEKRQRQAVSSEIYKLFIDIYNAKFIASRRSHVHKCHSRQIYFC